MREHFTRDRMLNALGVLAVVLAVGWLAWKSEWVEVDKPIAPRGEAATNLLYASQQLVRKLGGTVEQIDSIEKLPPQDATLLLTAWNWSLFPGRADELEDWVEDGGNAVISASMLGDKRLQEWLSVEREKPVVDKAAKAKKVDLKDERLKLTQTAAEIAARQCHEVTELDKYPASYSDGRSFRLCAVSGLPLVSKKAPSWTIDGPKGAEILRVPMGEGTVTIVGASDLFFNKRLLQGDNALLAAAILQARAGSEVWFATEETRDSIVAWLWSEAWVVVLLSALAIALALWRGAPRFGPIAAKSSVLRRSMAEQIIGTGEFLRSTGAGALHAAELRALEEAAMARVPQYARLGAAARTKAIAQATHIDAEELARAMDTSITRSPAAMPGILHLLETARRRLREPSSPSAPRAAIAETLQGHHEHQSR